jgi:hypothetical protein
MNLRRPITPATTGPVSIRSLSGRAGIPEPGSDRRYYPVLPVPAEQAIHHGPIGKIKDVVAEYAASGLDLLVLMPEVRSLRQLELLSEQVLPEYQH